MKKIFIVFILFFVLVDCLADDTKEIIIKIIQTLNQDIKIDLLYLELNDKIYFFSTLIIKSDYEKLLKIKDFKEIINFLNLNFLLQIWLN